MGFEVQIKNTATAGLNAMAQRSQSAAMVGLRRSAKVVQNMAIRQVQTIYRRSIPTTSQVSAYNRKSGGGKRPKRVGGKGKPAWKRTGDLLKAVQAEPVEKDGEIVLSADTPYAKSRHQLGAEDFGSYKGWTPKNPAIGVVRTNPWAKEAVEKTEPQIQPVFEAAYLRALKGKAD